MIQKTIASLLHRRHFWRYATFTEIAELYASRVLRMLALHMTVAFMSIYLYQHGYSVFFIACFWAIIYAVKAIITLPVAALVARLGPKHGMLISNLLYIPAVIAFAVLPQQGMWVLGIVIVFQTLSTVMYQISFLVDFSKVKSIDHAGKEIAYMNIIEKVTTGLSPLIGGALAFLLGPQVVLAIGAVLFALAALPLFHTREQVRPRQRLRFRGFPWPLIRRTATSHLAIGFDVFASGTVWTLFVAITIIGIQTSNEVYAASGMLLSVMLFTALAVSYLYGLLIDHRRGRELLIISVVVNSATHIARPFIGSPLGAVGMNIAKETSTTGYSMAYTRAVFDNADLSGARTTYIAIHEAIGYAGSAVAAIILAGLMYILPEVRGMGYFFLITAVVVLLILTARFPLYKK